MTSWHYAGFAGAALLGMWLALRLRGETSSEPAPSPGPHGAPVSPVTSEMTAWAKDLLADPGFPLGSEAERDFDGTRVLARAETHTWYGADASRPATPHKGISLYYA